MTASAPLLALEAVRVELAGREILAGVSLELRAGEVLTLAGPNGAGKTTLLRVASRVLAPSAGRVWIGGRPAGALSRRELARQLAVVPQEAQLAFPFSAGEVVLMGRAPHLPLLGFESRADVERARAAMAQVGVTHLADRSVLALSGGERQLVLVARALAQEARVLLLDEPTAHLDLRHRVAVLDQIRAFAARGGGALVVSHDLGLSAGAADRLALLCQGRLAGVGPPEQVLSPEALRRVFGVDAEILRGARGGVAVVPRAPAGPVQAS
jgi:iron complex transport system ATP-binding protein